MSITIIICEVETMKEPLVITMAREYASGGSEIAQKVADLLGIPLYNKGADHHRRKKRAA